MSVSFQNTFRVRKVIHMNVKNQVKILCFEGALLSALFLKGGVFFWKNENFGKNCNFYREAPPTLRGGRS